MVITASGGESKTIAWKVNEQSNIHHPISQINSNPPLKVVVRSNNTLEFSLNSKTSGDRKISLFDSFGKKLAQKTYTPSTAGISFNLSACSRKVIFFVVLTNGNIEYREKVVLVK